MRAHLRVLCCALLLAGCSSMYKLNHLSPKDQTEKEWTAITNPAPAPKAEPASATPSGQKQDAAGR